jgi:hypothetical protein
MELSMRKDQDPKATKKLSAKELEILNGAVQEFNALRNAAMQSEKSLNQALALIGDKHGVDFSSGKYNVDEKGVITLKAQNESV